MKFSSPTLLLALVLLAVAPGSQASTIQLPRTGQTSCYDTAGAVIPCAGTGQDGEILAGKPWPSPRFTDNSDGTVTDNLTGLVWLKQTNCTDTSGGISFSNPATSPYLGWSDSLTWANNLYSGICGLADGSAAGDWRMPNVKELQSMWDPRTSFPALPAGNPFIFDVSAVSEYTSVWTSDTSQDTDSAQYQKAYTVQLIRGSGQTRASWKPPYYFNFIWPVRDGGAGTVQIPKAGQTACWDDNGSNIPCAGTGQDGDKQKGAAIPEVRFTDNQNGTMTDNLTGLVWLQDANCLEPSGGINKDNNSTPDYNGQLDYDSALTWTKSLATGTCALTDGSLAGDWRVPNIRELQSIVDVSHVEYMGMGRPALPSGPYGNVGYPHGYSGYPLSEYWSSTSNGTAAYTVIMDDGAVTSMWKEYPYFYVWPVRGGQFGDAAASVLPASKDFGILPLGTTSAGQVITISNNGTTSRMHVNSIMFTGTDASQFSLSLGDGTGGTCGSTTPILAPGGNCSVTVSFSPSIQGNKAANLRVSTSDLGAPNTDIPLSGVTLVNAACGTANGSSLDLMPTTNLCTAGSPSAVTGTGPWSWNCNGYGGGTNTNCSANLKTYQFVFSSDPNGTLTGTTTQNPYYGGSTTAVTATPAAHYHFSNWSGDINSTSNPLVIASVTMSLNIKANFAIDTFSVNFASAGNGALSGNLSQVVNYGATSATVSAVPNPGYHLVNWTEGSTVVGTGTTLSIPNVTAAHSYTANFAINSYPVTFTPGTNGTLTGTLSQTINQGSSTTTVTAVPATGYHFVSWTEGTTVVGTGLALTVGNVTAAHSYTANFAMDTNAVTFASGGNGTLTGSTSQAVALGGNATTVTAVPATGYHFVNWTEGGTPVGTGAALNITNVTAPRSFTANFAPNTFTETFTSGANGSITGTVSQTVGYLGTTTAVTAVPAAGYHFVKWTEGASLVGNSATLVVANVAADHNYAATFAMNSYPVSYISGGNGTVVGSANQTVVHAADAATVTAIPAAGYHFVNWTEGSTEAGSSADLGITNVTASHIYKANFAINSYAVTYASGGNGTLTGSVSQTINHAGTATKVTAVPDLNYHFVNWTEGSTVAGTSAALTITNVTAVHSYTANFATNTSTVTFSSGANGTIAGNASQLVDYGADAATVTAVAGTGAQFLNWTEGGTVVGTSAALTVTKVTSARSFTANFTIPTVDAVCGTSNGAIVSVAPGSNLCTSGTATVPTGSGPWTWQCISANGGTAAQCSAIPQSFSVAPSAATGCSITPSTPVTVKAMASTKFTVATGTGYGTLVTGCGGTLSGSTYTTGAITADCTVTVSSVSRNANGTGSSEPTIVDALKALSSYSDKVQLTPVEKIRYDIAPLSATGVPLGNGTVDIADVIMIMRRAIGIGSW